MTVRYANEGDLALLRGHDRHIRADELQSSIAAKRVLVLLDGGRAAGWLRYNLFWDNLPFLNMLYLFEEYRGKGYGAQLVQYWEAEMARAGYREVLTSTLSDEQGQFFFRRGGYTDCGALLLPGEPLEIILRKELTEQTALS
jgi:GNAT superfamily N-acetyltransferase